jgi:acetyl esterase/lipase
MLRLFVRSLWVSGVSVENVRRRILRIDGLTRAVPRGASAHEVDANGVPCQWIIPHDVESDRVLFYLHGGGFSTHLPRLYANFAADLGTRLNAKVFLVDYRLAPEHPFPAAPDDCITAYQWLLEQPGVSADNLVMAGDSAGGNLTLVTLLDARQRGLDLPAAAWAISPGVDCRWDETTFRRLQDSDPMFTIDSLDFMEPYFGHSDRNDYRVSPVCGDMAGLPPLLIEAGGVEMLRQEPERFAGPARSAGVSVTTRVWKGMPHVFQVFGFLPEAKKARRDACQFLSEHMAPAP